MRRLIQMQANGLPDGLRFVLAGGFAASVNWLVRFPLSAVMPFEAAVGLAYMIGMSAGFPIYRRWVFPGSQIPITAQITRFLAVNALGGVIVLAAALVLASGFEYGGISKEIADALGHGLAIGIGAFANFFGHKFVTFATSGAGMARLTINDVPCVDSAVKSCDLPSLDSRHGLID